MKKLVGFVLTFAGALALLWATAALLPADAGAETAREGPEPVRPLDTDAIPQNIGAVSSYSGQATAWTVAGPIPAAQSVVAVPIFSPDTTLHLHNPVGTNPANFVVAFLDAGGTIQVEYPGVIPAHGSLSVDLTAVAGLPEGYWGGALISSDMPVQAIADAQHPVAGGLVSYEGGAVGSTELALPAVFADYYGWNSLLLIQSLGDAEASVATRYYDQSGTLFYETTESVPALGTLAYDPAQDTPLAPQFRGWVQVTSTLPVVAAVELWRGPSGEAAAYSGLLRETADAGFFAPRQHGNPPSERGSAIDVVNLGAVSSDIGVTWYYAGGGEAGSGAWPGLAPEAFASFLPWMYGIPDGFDGAGVGSADEPAASLVTWRDPAATGDGFAASIGTPLALAGLEVSVPRVGHVLAKGVGSEISVQNTASDLATVVVTYYEQDGDLTAELYDTIPGHGVRRYPTDSVPGVGDSWEGAAAVLSDQPVAVEVMQYILAFPDIGVDPLSIESTLYSGETTSATLTIGNSGDADLDWSMAEAPAAGWLVATPTSGAVSPGASTGVTVTLDAAGLSAGIHTTALEITSNDPDTPEVTVPVTLTVALRPPEIVVSPAWLETTLQPGESVTLTVEVTNTGELDLDWSLTEQPGADWLAELPTGGTVPPGTGTGVAVHFDATGLAPDEYATTLRITSNDPDTPQVDVPVTLTVEILLPEIGVSPASLATTLRRGELVTLTLGVTNSGEADLNWSLAEEPGVDWLAEAPAGGTVLPGTGTDVAVRFDATGLAPDEYATTLRITSNDPDTPQVNVPVTLTVEFEIYLPLVLRNFTP